MQLGLIKNQHYDVLEIFSFLEKSLIITMHLHVNALCMCVDKNGFVCTDVATDLYDNEL